MRYFPFPPIIAIQRLRLRYFDWDCQRVGLSEGRGVEILRYFDFEILRLRYFDWDYQRVGLSEGCQASSWWRRLLGGWPPLAVVPTETSLRSHLPPSPTSEKADFLNTPSATTTHTTHSYNTVTPRPTPGCWTRNEV